MKGKRFVELLSLSFALSTSLDLLRKTIPKGKDKQYSACALPATYLAYVAQGMQSDKPDNLPINSSFI